MAAMSNCIIAALILLAAALALLTRTNAREPFQSVVNCVDQGYPQDFCMRVPPQAVISSGYCNCANGELGTRDGPTCVCSPVNPTFPYYPTRAFNDWLR